MLKNDPICYSSNFHRGKSKCRIKVYALLMPKVSRNLQSSATCGKLKENALRPLTPPPSPTFPTGADLPLSLIYVKREKRGNCGQLTANNNKRWPKAKQKLFLFQFQHTYYTHTPPSYQRPQGGVGRGRAWQLLGNLSGCHLQEAKDLWCLLSRPEREGRTAGENDDKRCPSEGENSVMEGRRRRGRGGGENSKGVAAAKGAALGKFSNGAESR